MAKLKINICRVYEAPEKKKGLWILVDRLWPRGIKKNELSFDTWLKEIAPSPSLRKWFHHEKNKWTEFANQYIEELKDKEELITELQKEAVNQDLTLFYAAKDKEHNHALVIRDILNSWPKLPRY